MPKRIDPHARGVQVYLAVRDLVRDGGIEAVTIRRVAAQAELATSSLRQGYRDKDFLLRCIVHEVTHRFSRATYNIRPIGDPIQDVVDWLGSQIARDDEGRADGLVWLALVERARAVDDDIRDAISAQRSEWLAMSSQSVEHLRVAADARELEALRLAVLLEALIAAVCDPNQRLDRAQATDLLRLHARRLHEAAPSSAA
jgi:AcrR family transcriptional regulator